MESGKSELLVDLHGLSIDKARSAVNRHLKLAEPMGVGSIRFVTGRGNHINSRGERGTLLREFPNWLSEDNLGHTTSVKKHDGYYEVGVKSSAEKPALISLFEKFSQQWLIDNLEQIKALAQKEDPESQYLIGHCYQYGIIFEQDYVKAVEWYQKAVKANYAGAQHALGGCYFQGKGVRQNDLKAIELFKQAATQNFVWALHQLGDIYRYGDGVKQDLELAKNYYQQASDLGLVVAKRKLAHMYYFVDDGQKDEKKAYALYKEAADMGDAHASYNVAQYYLKDKNNKKNCELGFKYAKQAADLNDRDAQYLVAMLYQQGIGTAQDLSLSYDYLKRSANNNFKHALFELVSHANTEDQRIIYLLKAAKAEHLYAQAIVLMHSLEQLLPANEQADLLKSFWQQSNEEILAMPSDKMKFMVINVYLRIDNLTKKQKAKILFLLNSLAQQQHLEALLILGSIYSQGLLGDKNMQKAEQYWQQGAKLNDPDCLCSLGYLYEEKAQADEAAYKIAFAYHEKAAKQGSANSYNQLGLLYKEGKGVKKDIALAVKCFYQALHLDNEEKKLNKINRVSVYSHAAFNLALLYFKGDEGFPSDEQQALHWMTIAADAGYESAKLILERMGLSASDQPKHEKHEIGFWKTQSKLLVEEKTPREILDVFVKTIGLAVNWQITESDKAWCYIDSKQKSFLEKYSLQPFTIRQTVNKQFILLLEKISTYDLLEITDGIKAQIKSTVGLKK